MAAFVTARLDEWEAAAKAAAADCPPPWRDDYGDLLDASGTMIVDGVDYGGAAWRGDTIPHIALHDPASTPRLVASLRAILAEHLHAPVSACARQHGKPDFGCENCAWDREEGVYPAGWCVTVRQVAAIWSTHPQYQERWKP